METIRIFRLTHLRPSHMRRLDDAQREAARLWLFCRDMHLHARREHLPWPTRDDLQRATKGRFQLHSQTVQMICHAFLANVETTKHLKREQPRMRYPYKDKRYYPLVWPAQAVCIEPHRVVLPMGRGRPSLVFRLAIPAGGGACRLVWKDGYELHVSYPQTESEQSPGSVRAAVDLGEIHQAAVSTNIGVALVVSGRGIRTLKRRRNKTWGEIGRKLAWCKRGSKRWRKLQAARRKVVSRIERQVRDLRHKGTRKVIDFCVSQGVGTIYVGHPSGVQRRRAGRHHNQRMSQWEFGKDIEYLKYKSQLGRIMCFTGTERGTSSQCPACGVRKRPQGRVWRCGQCGFSGHRDVVGSANMHMLAFGERIEFPARITYLRPGPDQGWRRSEEPSTVARAGT